ncbi:enoyl-CoA hydratase/isomerase family protein [Chloroflexota bacterium]
MTAIVYQKKGSIGYITINRPEAMNALNSEVRQGLEEALIQIRDDVEVRAAILTSAGDKAFSVGADLKQREAKKPTSDSNKLTYFDLPASLGVWTPIIAAINGYCLGAGFFLALSCDIRIASENSMFGIPEVALGIAPAGGVTQWLPRLVPAGLALKLLLTGERFSASDAYRLGLVTEVVPKDDLISAAERIAGQISNNGPLAVKAVKRAFWEGRRYGMDEGLRLERELNEATRQSEDVKEAKEAFIAKRKPVFKGK